MKFTLLIPLFIAFLPLSLIAQEADIHLYDAYAHGNDLSITGTADNKEKKTLYLAGITSLGKEKPLTQIAINDLIEGQDINCKPILTTNTQTKAQCLNQADQDIALNLLQSGFVMTNRADLEENEAIKNIYLEAELNARKALRGLWVTVLTAPSQNPQQNTHQPFSLASSLGGTQFYILIAALIASPFLGMLVVSFVMYGGFRRLISLQKLQISQAQKRDRTLREREKFIVAASLEGEINTNRAKLDAFILIYEEMLKSLRDSSKEPKYKKGGDIIHAAPSLSRNVYDSNMDKMDLLSPSLVADLTALYMDVEPSPDYQTFEPETPIEDVIEFVATVIARAEDLLQPMYQISGALNVIVRDQKTKSPNRKI